MLVTVWVTTGGNFIGFKAALETIPPFLMMSVRLLCAGAILFLAFGLRRPTGLNLTQVRSAAIAGVLLLVASQGAIVWGVQVLPAGIAAVLSSTAPLFLALLSFLVLRERISGRQLTGILVGFAGIALLAMTPDRDGELELAGAIWVLFGAACWAVGSLYEERADMPPHPMVAAALQMLFAAGVMFALSVMSGELARFDPDRVSLRSVAGLAYLAAFGLVVGFAAFVWLGGASSMTLANTFHYVSPVVAMLAATWLLSETLTWPKVAAAVVTLAGVASIVSGERRQTRGRQAPAATPSSQKEAHS